MIKVIVIDDNNVGESLVYENMTIDIISFSVNDGKI